MKCISNEWTKREIIGIESEGDINGAWTMKVKSKVWFVISSFEKRASNN